MSPTKTADGTLLDRSERLGDITSQLRGLARELRAGGRVEEADSLTTTIRDLDWQSDRATQQEAF